MAKLLTSDTARRLTAAEVLEHPWLTVGASKPPFLKTVINNLRGFTASTKFKTGILKIMADSMSEKDLADLRQVFEELDEDGDGKITVAELSHAMEKAGTSARKDSETLAHASVRSSTNSYMKHTRFTARARVSTMFC
jgi:calcium-dependent protein kinase